MLVTCVPPANKPVGPAFDFFSVLYFNLYARTGHISHVCLRLYIAPVAPVWWSLIALLIHFYTPQPCQIRHPPPQAYPWPLTSSRQLKVGWCALILAPQALISPRPGGKTGSDSKSLVQDLGGQVLSACGLLGTFQAAAPSLLHVLGLRQTPTDPPPSCPTFCLANHHSYIQSKSKDTKCHSRTSGWEWIGACRELLSIIYS